MLVISSPDFGWEIDESEPIYIPLRDYFDNMTFEQEQDVRHYYLMTLQIWQHSSATGRRRSLGSRVYLPLIEWIDYALRRNHLEFGICIVN